MSARDVLSAFHRDAPYLFLGAAFVAVGLVSAAFAAIRRKYDALLIYFALFAAFYGLRLWIQSSLLGMTVHGSTFYTRLRSGGIDYIVLIPAFLFFASLGLPRRTDRNVGYAMGIIGGVLAGATFIGGDSTFYHLINNVVVIAALIFFTIRFMRGSAAERNSPSVFDLVVMRWGLVVFVAFALWQNIAGMLLLSSRVEPFGFVAFLSSLGYVAARRALQRDQELNQIQKELECLSIRTVDPCLGLEVHSECSPVLIRDCRPAARGQ